MLVAFFLSSWPGLAMRPSYESLDRVLARTRVAIVAEIGRVEETRLGDIAREIAFSATPFETIFGSDVPFGPLDCRYRQGLVHRRGDLTVAPLISGSGIEFRVKPGDRVILLIGVAEGAESCNVLRIERLDRRRDIKAPSAIPGRDQSHD
jgi:hypothetical protein